jgi:hypothetical protein
MANLDVKPTYYLQVTAEELRLIGLGLAGKLKTCEEKAALELNVRLQELREKQTRMIHESSVAALESAKGVANGS